MYFAYPVSNLYAGMEKKEVYVETSEDDITFWPYPESYDGDDILSLPARLADFDTAFILQAEEGFQDGLCGFQTWCLPEAFPG